VEQVLADYETLLAENKRMRTLILQFAMSYTLCDHLGDVADDLDKLLKEIGVVGDWDTDDAMVAAIHNLGVHTTLWGSSMSCCEEEPADD
jgi:uncharacterized protein YijF (DUF1287 family)